MYEHLKQAWQELTGPGQPFEVTTETVGSVPIRTFRHAPPSLREIWLSTAGYADKDYLVFSGERCTYSEAHTFTASIARWLHDAGVGPGDRVAIAMRNYPEWMLAYWAVTSMGAVVVGMNAWWVAQEMAFALEDSVPQVLICDRERLQRFSEIRERFSTMKVVTVRLQDEAPVWATDWVEVINARPDLPAVTIAPEDDACIFYTSGTTGRPKGARLTHRGCVANVMNVAFINTVQPMAMALAKGTTPPAPGSSPAPNSLLATPLFHVLGPVDQEDKSVLIDTCDVARMQPAVGDRLGGRIRAVQVTLDDRRAAHPELTDGVGTEVLTRGPHTLGLQRGHGGADAGRLVDKKFS